MLVFVALDEVGNNEGISIPIGNPFRLVTQNVAAAIKTPIRPTSPQMIERISLVRTFTHLSELYL